MSLLVYFNGRLVDLAPNTVLAYTYNGIKPGELQGRSVPHSNKLVGIFSDNNDQIFGIARDSKVDPTIPYIKNDCVIVQSGYEIISNGKAVVQKTNEGYEFVAYSDIAVLIEELGSKTIDQLSSIVNATSLITWSASEIDSRRDDVEGVMAPVINYGQFADIQFLLNNDFSAGLDDWEALNLNNNLTSFPQLNNQGWGTIDNSGNIAATVQLETYYSATNGTWNGFSQVLRQRYKIVKGLDYTITLSGRATDQGGSQGADLYVRLYKEDGITFKDYRVDFINEAAYPTFSNYVLNLSPDQDWTYFGFYVIMIYDGPDATTASQPEITLVTIGITLRIGDYYLPSVSYRDIIRSILKDNSYQEGALDIIPNINKFIIPFCKSSLTYTGFFNTCREFFATINPITIAADASIKFDVITKKDLYGYYNPTDGTYSNGNNYQFKKNPSGDGRSFYVHFFVNLKVKVVGTATISIRDQAGTIQFVALTAGTRTINFTVTSNLTDTTGYKMTGGSAVDVYCDVAAASSVEILDGSFSNKVIGNNLETTPKFYAQEILPEIKQVDFLKDALVRFGVVLKEKKKIVTAKRIDDIINDKINVMDWSNKRINKLDEIVYSEFEYAQINKFTYPEFDSFFKALYYNYDMVVENKNLPGSKLVYESIFGGSADVSIGDQTTFTSPAMVRIWNESPEGYPIDNQNAFDNSPGLRLLIWRNKLSAEAAVYYNGNSRTDYKMANFNEPDSKYMAWEAFVKDNMSSLERSIRKNKTLYRYYQLTAEDVYNVDSHKLMHDNGEYFIVENFSNWVEGIEIKAKLFKVN